MSGPRVTQGEVRVNGVALQRARLNAGLKQAEVIERIPVPISASTLSRIENGTRESMRLELLGALAQLYQVNLDLLTFESPTATFPTPAATKDMINLAGYSGLTEPLIPELANSYRIISLRALLQYHLDAVSLIETKLVELVAKE